MTLRTDEPEIVDGSRAWVATQLLFKGQADPTRKRHTAHACWYDTTVDENEGAFCVIQAESELEELVGETVRVAYRNKVVYLFCVGGSSDLPVPLGLTRQAMMRLADLAKDHIDVTVQPVH